MRMDAPALASFRGGLAPEAIVPLGGGAQMVAALGPLLGSTGFGGYARISLAAKSPNQHGSYGMHSGLFVEVSAQDSGLLSRAVTAGFELDLGLLALPVLAAARPLGHR